MTQATASPAKRPQRSHLFGGVPIAVQVGVLLMVSLLAAQAISLLLVLI